MEDTAIAGTKDIFLSPERIASNFGLSPGDHVADFGAGHGYFTLPMARIVGGDGKIYAIDIQKPVLEIIRSRAQIENLLNIELVWGNLDEPDGSHLKDLFLEFVLISNILFQAEHKENLLAEAYRILQDGGHLAILEWSKASLSLGPPSHTRIEKDATRALAEKAGFTFDHEFDAGSHHYGLLFRK